MKFIKKLLLSNQYTLLVLSLAYLLIAIMISVIYAVQVNRYVSKELNAKLTFNVNNKQQKVESWLKNYQSDINFIAKLPAVRGYVNASLHNDADKAYGNSVERYQGILSDIFASFMVSKPDVFKMRIIGLAGNGRELIRYNQLNGVVSKVPESALQEKEKRSFFKEIIKLKNNQIYISEIDLNQDNNQISTPHQPTIRLGTPLYGDDGQLFGMFVINYDANYIVNDLARDVYDDDQTQTLLVNDRGEYLVHPDQDKTFAFDLGKHLSWLDDFKVKAANKLTALRTSSVLDEGEDGFFVTRDIALDVQQEAQKNAQNQGRKLTLIGILSTKSSIQAAWSAGLYAFATLFALGLLVAFAFYRARTNAFIKSEQIKHQAKLDAEIQARQMIEYATYAQVLVDHYGLILLVNIQAEKIFGYGRDEIIGQPVEVLIPKRLRQQHIHYRNTLLQQPDTHPLSTDISFFAITKKGQEFPVEIGFARIDTSGDTKILISILDVSERNAREEALRKTARDLERTGFLAHVGGMEMDLLTGAVTLSKEACVIHGFLEQDQKTFDEIFALYDSESQTLIKTAIDKTIAQGESWDLELKLTKVSGQTIWVRTQGYAEYIDNKPTHLVGAIHEITNLKNSIEELNHKNKELNNFAYVASHDLKSPLRGLDQIASWLEEDLAENMSEQTKVYLRLMRSRIKRMEQLLADLLAYARAGAVYGEPEMVNMTVLVQDVFNLCCYENNFSLKLVGDFPHFLTSKTPLEIIFRNLISNAIKHHDLNQGEITISALLIDRFYQFEVADDGPGIPVEYAERAFGMFQTLRPRDEIEGSGMGLAIVKKTIESLGGKIHLKANTPRGAIFSFTWPKIIKPK